MKRSLVIVLYLLLNLSGKAQSADTITTLDIFFAGIPVKEGFTKWVEYLYKHPHLGLDSANYRGSYSSLKPGIKSHFPFPDSVKVKILAENELRKIPNVNNLIRHNKLIIEVVFGNSNESETSSRKCFEQLKKIVKKYYKIRDNYKSKIDYSKGININFPDFTLLIDYSKELDFYFVMMITEEEDTIAIRQ